MSTLPYANNLVTEVTEPTVHYKSIEFEITKAVQPGSVFIGRDTALPRHISFETCQLGNWHLLNGTSSWDVDRQIRNAGWQFPFFPQQVSAWAVGLNRDAVLRTALLRLLRRLEGTQFNAVEIKQISHERSLGFYLGRVSAHLRSVRPTTVPSGLARVSTQETPWRYPWDL